MLVAASAYGSPRVVGGHISQHPGYQQAGESGAVLEVSPGLVVRLEAGAQVTPLPVQHMRLPETGSTRVFPFLLRQGRVDVQVEPSAGRPAAVLMSTQRRVMGIAASGTATFVATTEGLLVANVGGSVLGLQKSGWEVVPQFERRLYANLNRPPERSPLPLAPTWSRRQLILAAPGDTIEAPLVAWSPVSGAARYELELAVEASDVRRIETSDPRIPAAVVLPRGRHSWRCRALDMAGVPGRWSEPLVTRIVGLQVPPGAVVHPGGTVALGPGQKVSFEDADDLIVWNDATHHTVPATSLIGLGPGDRTLLALRAPGSLDFALVKLVRRQVRATVRAGPKYAFWPHDTIELKYRVEDREGNAVGDVEPEARVTLDARPLEVEWRRSGRWMVATVPPRSGCGRCVVRVEVVDQNGVHLGRDSVEIVEIPARPRAAGR